MGSPSSGTDNCTDYDKIDVTRCTTDQIYRAEKAFAEKHTKWLYIDTKGAMLALVYSLNAVSFAPVSDYTHFKLDYRKVSLSVTQGEGFKFVSISADALIDPGRLRCTEPDCAIAVRFDQGPLKYFSTARNTEASLSIVSPDSFLADVRAAKRAYIVFPLEDLGNVTFEFDVSGYKW